MHYFMRTWNTFKTLLPTHCMFCVLEGRWYFFTCLFLYSSFPFLTSLDSFFIFSLLYNKSVVDNCSIGHIVLSTREFKFSSRDIYLNNVEPEAFLHNRILTTSFLNLEPLNTYKMKIQVAFK